MEFALGAAFFYAWSVTCARRSSAHHGPDLANLGRLLVALVAVGAFVALSGRQPFSAGWGWWLFNQPRVYSDHILWNADYLPAGTYQLTYTIVPSLAGAYRVLPAHAWLANFPEVQGTTSGAIFEIKP